MGHTQDPLAANQPTNDLLALAGVMDLGVECPPAAKRILWLAGRDSTLGFTLGMVVSRGIFLYSCRDTTIPKGKSLSSCLAHFLSHIQPFLCYGWMETRKGALNLRLKDEVESGWLKTTAIHLQPQS